MPETKKGSELLREMQREKQHMRVVIDEYGGVAGLVTIEDLLEAIVGSIADEHDEAEEVAGPARESDGAFVLPAASKSPACRELFAEPLAVEERVAEDGEPTDDASAELKRALHPACHCTFRSTTRPPPSAAWSPRSPATSLCPAKSSSRTASGSKFSNPPTAR